MARYLRKSLSPLTQGVHLGKDTVNREPQFATNLSNVRIRDGVIQKRPGSQDYTSSGALAGTIVSLFEYKHENGNVELVACTGGAGAGNRRIYNSTGGGNWANITGAVTMNGTALEPYDATVGPNGSRIDNLYLSNGSSSGTSQILRWDGAAFAYVGASPGTAKTLCTFANRIILGNIYDGVAVRGSLIQWSADGDGDTWPAAGFNDLVSTPDQITKLMVIRDRLIIYKDSSIFIGQETGLPTIPISFSLFSRNVGAIAPFSIAAGSDRHFFLGADDVYAFDGASATPIGAPIRPILRNINASRYRQCFSEIDPNFAEYRLYFPEGDSDIPKRALVYNWYEGHWTIWEFPQGVTAGVRGSTGGGPTWATVTGTWDDYSTISWDALSVSGAPTTILGMADLSTDNYSYKLSNDGAVGIVSVWESKDEDMGAEIATGGRPISTVDNKLLTRVTLRTQRIGATTTAAVSVSVDGGLSYQSAIGPATVTDGGETNYDIWLTGKKFRVRIANSQASQPFPAVQEITLHYKDRGEAL